MIAELVGVPVAERNEFVYWTNVYAAANAGDANRVGEAQGWIGRYLGELIDRRLAEPATDVESGTLLDGLIAVSDDDDRLNRVELLAMAFLLLAAGYETTVNLLGNGVLTLLRHPDQLAALRADPGLVGAAVEEFLRYEPPVKLSAAVRVATTDLTIGGVTIPAHEPVLLSLAAANRDPARFSEPDRFDIFRTEGGHHLAFSHGIHFCLGAPLARLEAEVAFPALLAGCPDLRLAVPDDALPWRHSRIIRGLRSLPVTFTTT